MSGVSQKKNVKLQNRRLKILMKLVFWLCLLRILREKKSALE